MSDSTLVKATIAAALIRSGQVSLEAVIKSVIRGGGADETRPF